MNFNFDCAFFKILDCLYLKEKQRGSPLLNANKHTHIYIKYKKNICILYKYYLFV